MLSWTEGDVAGWKSWKQSYVSLVVNGWADQLYTTDSSIVGSQAELATDAESNRSSRQRQNLG